MTAVAPARSEALPGFMPSYPMDKQIVYVHRDDRGRALYIGVSSNPWQRWTQHFERSPWYREVARIDFLGEYDTRREALTAEADAILAFQPPFNRNGRTGKPVRERTVSLDCECPFGLGLWVATL